MAIDMDAIKVLRDETGAGILEVKKALDDFGGDVSKVREELMKKVAAKAAKKADRVTKDGLIISYIHAGGKVGSIVHLACETDFVAKTPDFKTLGNEVAMQACTDDYENVESLLASEYIRDPSKTIQDLINEVIAKVGEKIELISFSKLSVKSADEE